MTDFMGTSEILEILPITKMTLSRWVKNGDFPAPIKIGGSNFWHRKTIYAALRGEPTPEIVDHRSHRNNDDII